MILNYILLFVASAIIFSLLIPKPDIEDAQAQQFDEDGFPKATENAPIPLLVGKARLNSPNTLFAGGFRTKKLTERVKTGLFSSKKVTIGFEYFLTLDLGFCLGDDFDGVTLHQLIVDDVVLFNGSLRDSGPGYASFSVFNRDLFGGKESGGGFSANCRWYPGTFQQPTDSYIDGLPGSGGLQVPYRGVAHLVLEDAYIGESPQLRGISIVASRFTNRLGLSASNRIIDGETLNWAEGLYEVLSSEWGGLAADTDILDFSEFVAVGNVLAGERNGVGGVVQNATEGEAFVKQFLRQADALLTIDPTTNLVKPFLLRKDYDAGTLPVLQPGQIKKVKKFTQTLWNELVSEVKGGWRNPENNYQDTTAVAQDLAVANITNRLRTTTIQLPFVKDSQLANDIVGRELNQLSQIVTQVTMEVDRNAFNFTPGFVFKWTWPDFNITEMILRVKDITEGDDNSPTIIIEAVRDTYDNTNNPFATAPNTGAVPIVPTLTAIVDYEFFWAPEFIAVQMTGNLDAEEYVNDPLAGYIYMLPEPPNGAVALSGIQEGDASMFNNAPFPSQGQLNSSVAQFDNFDTMTIPTLEVINVDDDFFDDFPSGPGSSGTREGQGLLYINGEILGYNSYTNNGGGSVTLNSVRRALLNTRQRDLTIASTVFFLDGSTVSEAVAEIDGSIDVKLLPSNGVVQLSEEDVSAFSLGTSTALVRPDPPDYTTIEGSRTFDGPSDGSTITIAYRARDKSKGTVQLTTDSADTEPVGMQYQIEIYNVTDGFSSVTNTGVFSGQTRDITLPTGLAGDELEVRVYSYISPRYSLTYDPFRFTVAPPAALLVTGDQQSGTDNLLTSGDQQGGGDKISLSGDQV